MRKNGRLVTLFYNEIRRQNGNAGVGVETNRAEPGTSIRGG